MLYNLSESAENQCTSDLSLSLSFRYRFDVFKLLNLIDRESQNTSLIRLNQILDQNCVIHLFFAIYYY